MSNEVVLLSASVLRDAADSIKIHQTEKKDKETHFLIFFPSANTEEEMKGWWRGG